MQPSLLKLSGSMFFSFGLGEGLLCPSPFCQFLLIKWTEMTLRSLIVEGCPLEALWSPRVWMKRFLLLKTDTNKQCSPHCWSFLVRCSFLLGWGRAGCAQTLFVKFYWQNEQKWNSGVWLLRVALLRLSPSMASPLKPSCLNGSIFIVKNRQNKQCSPHCWNFLVRCSFLLGWGRACWPKPLWLSMSIFVVKNRPK